MSYSFQTIDSKVLKSTNKVDIPDWIDDIAFKEKVDRQFDLEPNASIINQKHIVASRTDNNLAFVRDIKNSFNDKSLKTYAIVKLSSFLTKKRYAINNTVVDNDTISFDVTFDNNPAHYTFSYFIDNGNIKNKKFFTASLNDQTNEYSFSNAGLEDSFEDAKNNFDKKRSYQVKQSNRQFTVMTRYEIVQRCNNSLEKASELINRNLKEGNIVGVGSNEYASYYDMNYLFPDMRNDYVPQQVHTAEYVDNSGQSKINEKKTAERLALEATKIINKNFKVAKTISQSRSDDSIAVTAEIVNKDIRRKLDFVFNISNEKIASLKEIHEDGKILSLDELKEVMKNDEVIASYTNNDSPVQNKCYIYSIQKLKNKLNSFVDNTDKLIADWQKASLVKKLEDNKLVSDYSLNELLEKCDARFLTDEEIKAFNEQKQRFGINNKFYQYETEDNDTRNKLALYAQQNKINKIANYIGQYFNNFNLDLLSDEDIVIMFVIDDKPNSIYAKVNYDGNNISDIICKVGNRRISVKNSKNIFQKSKLLKSYLKDNDSSSNYNIIISKAMFYEKLNDYLNREDIDSFVEKLIKNNALTKISSEKFASKNSFDELINMCDSLPIEGLKEQNLALKDKTTNLKFDSIDVKDNDTRNKLALYEQQDKLDNVINFVAQYLNNFNLDLLSNEDAVIVLVVDDKPIDIYAKINYDNNQISDMICKIGSKNVSIKNLKNAFKKNELLKAYLKDNDSSPNTNIVISKAMFYTKLGDYLSKEAIDSFVKKLLNKKELKIISSDRYASKSSFNELINLCDELPVEKLKEQNLALKDKTTNLKFDSINVKDNDTRNKLALYEQQDKVNEIVDFVSQYLNNFNIDLLSNEDAVIVLIVDGKPNSIYAKIERDSNKIKNISCKIGRRVVSIKNLKNIFKKSKLLNAYLKDNDSSIDCNIIVSKTMFHSKLENYLNKDTINSIIDNLVDKKELTIIASNKYASKKSFDELINLCNELPIEGLKEKNNSLKDKTSMLKFDSSFVQDNDTRNKIATAALEDYAYSVNSYIKKYIDYFTVDLIDKQNIVLNLCGKNVYASILYDGEIKDIVCDINKRKISISKLENALKRSELLQSYLNDNDEANYQGFVITKKAFYNKLKDYISEQQISALIGYLEDTKQIKRIASDKFASEMSFDELLRNIEIVPDNSLKTKHLNLANRLKDYEFDKENVNDSDNRLIKQELTELECKKQIIANMPESITVKSITDLTISNDSMSSTLKLFNTKKGISTVVKCVASVDNAKLKDMIYLINNKPTKLEDTFNCNLLTEKIVASSNKNHFDSSVVFTINDLKEQLKYLTDEKMIEEALKQWEKQGKIQKIDSSKFASKQSLNDLIVMSNLKPYKEDVTKQKYQQATRSKESIPKAYHTNNFEAKVLSSVSDGKTTTAFDENKDKVLALAESYLKQEIITSKKLDKIKTLIASVKTPTQLDTIYKDLQRYSL